MFEPANDLERKLMLAADHPENRPDFYKALLSANVLVIGFSEGDQEGVQTLSAGAKLSIVNWQKPDGSPVIPFFSSLEALQRALTEEAKYVSLPVRSFFEITLGSALVLNPSSAYGKEFFPEEVRTLLDTGVNHAPQTRVVEKPTEVLLGQPAQYPDRMVAALAAVLARHPVVKAAYLCLMHDPSASERPSLVVGLEGDGDLAQALKEAGAVAADTAPQGEQVDFVLLKRGEGGISRYMFDSVKPFYPRGWRSKLRALF